jgi:glucan biosynthesis protein C
MATLVDNVESAEPQPPLPEGRAPARPRLLYLDNLRTAVITSVVLVHLSGSYGIEADWMYREGGEASVIFSVLGTMAVAIAVSSVMGLFFLIAGHFTPPAFDRRGAGQFLVDRLKRLGIPWLIYEVAINPFLHYAVDVHGGDCKGALYDCQYQGTFWRYLWEFPRVSGSFGDGPVWFLEALLIFSGVYVLCHLATRRVPRVASGSRGASPTVPGNGAIALFALAIGLSTFVVRIWVRAFVQYEPFHLEFARFPQYIALFAAGVWAYRRGWLAAFPDRQARRWRWVALACVLALPVLVGLFGGLSGEPDPRFTGGLNWLSLAFSLWEGFLCVSISISLLTWFRRRFDHQGRLVRAMSESSFAVYVLHPGVIVPLALALSGIRMNLSVKFLLVAPVAVALCYLVAYGLRKVPQVRAVFG